MATTQSEEQQKKKARNEMPEKGPNPAHKLLDAISNALKAGVPPEQVVLLVDMARKAYGTDQGTSWKMVAGTLNEYAQSARTDWQTAQSLDESPDGAA